MTEEEKARLIKEAIASEAAGRKILLRNPFDGLIPRRLDTLEISRKAFPIEKMPQGAAPIYDREPLRKCEECGCIFGHEPGCSMEVVEDVSES